MRSNLSTVYQSIKAPKYNNPPKSLPRTGKITTAISSTSLVAKTKHEDRKGPCAKMSRATRGERSVFASSANRKAEIDRSVFGHNRIQLRSGSRKGQRAAQTAPDFAEKRGIDW